MYGMASNNPNSRIPSKKTDGRSLQRISHIAEMNGWYPVIINTAKPESGRHTNYSYRDFRPPVEHYSRPKRIAKMSFPEKMHETLSNVQSIHWMPPGRSFRIQIPRYLEESHVLLVFFGHKRYSNFLGQLSNHSFKHVTSGRNRIS